MGAITPWADADIQELKRLATTLFEGSYLSHRAIGAAMNRSRNAIIGKMHRLKIKRDPLVPIQGVDHRVVPAGQAQQREQKVSRVPTAYGRAGPSRAPRAYACLGEAPPVRSPHARTLLESTGQTCHFPLGHVGQEGFHLCGDKVGDRAPYCTYHASICYVPLKERQKSYYLPGHGIVGS